MSPRSERRYGTPPKIKLAMPSAATAAAAAPKASVAAGTDGVPVTATVTKPGSTRV